MNDLQRTSVHTQHILDRARVADRHTTGVYLSERRQFRMHWTYHRTSLRETQNTIIERNTTKVTSVYDKPPVYVRQRSAVTVHPRSSRPACDDQGPGGEHCQPIARDQRRLSVTRTMRMNAKPGKNSEPTRLVILGESGVGKSGE